MALNGLRREFPYLGYVECFWLPSQLSASRGAGSGSGPTARCLPHPPTFFPSSGNKLRRRQCRRSKRIAQAPIAIAPAPTSCNGPAQITSCSASSEYSKNFICENAYGAHGAFAANGNSHTEWATRGEGVGSWIELDFQEPIYINSMMYINRAYGEANRRVKLTFSDGSSQEPDQDLWRPPNYQPGWAEEAETREKSTVPLNGVGTSSVKIEVLEVWSINNNGAREIEFSCQTTTTTTTAALSHELRSIYFFYISRAPVPRVLRPWAPGPRVPGPWALGPRVLGRWAETKGPGTLSSLRKPQIY